MPWKGWPLLFALVPSSLLAGPRIAPVAAVCPAERPERAIDADGVRDRCVARAEAACPAGADLRTDATGVADACVVAGAAREASAGKGKPPKCGSGFRLQVAAGKDACEKAGPSSCPSGSHLEPRRGEDLCRY